MAKRKKQQQKKEEETLIDLVSARDQAQGFMDRNQNLVFGILVGIVVIIGGVFAYNKFVKEPKQQEAVLQVWKAEEQFFRDSFNLALANPGGGYEGLSTIVEEYGSVPTGNAAAYYAGISCLHTGKYEAAVSYLKDVKADGQVMGIMKYGALGDAYSELNQFDKALSSYKSAVNATPNDALTPIYLLRYGMLNEKQGKSAEAKKAYQRIKDEFSTSTQARDAERYLSRLP
ncbi:MAG: tetratricopeptide repeat protein, partial [Phaeodactylibacter sp.]|nr:tetratricopeptide repeat protein [Phaeodactylibacter sp.]